MEKRISDFDFPTALLGSALFEIEQAASAESEKITLDNIRDYTLSYEFLGDWADINPLSKANAATVMNAGNGLVGGGNIAVDRTFSLGIPSTITNATTNSVTTSSHTHALTLVSGDITGALGFTPASAAISILAGNGLSGGGTMAASRTLTLGTPGTLTSDTGNAVTATSHTHNIQLDHVYSNDDRSVPLRTTPDTYRARGMSYAFNTPANVGAGSGTYVTTLTLFPWTVYNNIYRPVQFIFDGDGVGLHFRRAANATTWDTARKIYTDNDPIALSTTSMIAGNGLTGGGTLAASRTITMGLPSTLTGATNNAVTASSHTHAIDLNVGTQTLAATESAYPLSVASVGDAGTGFPAVGTLLTAKINGNRVMQLYSPFQGGSGTPDLYFRTSHTTVNGGGWTGLQKLWHEGNFNPATKADAALTLTAGNGLSGGGTLAANRTFTLGTPSTVSGSTTNSVTASSHTHALSANLSAWDGVTPSGFVDTSSNQTIGGWKTFSTLITVNNRVYGTSGLFLVSGTAAGDVYVRPNGWSTSGQTRFHTSGEVEASSFFTSQGSTAGFQFHDRTNSVNPWTLYATGNEAHIFRGGAGGSNRFTVTSDGDAKDATGRRLGYSESPVTNLSAGNLTVNATHRGWTVYNNSTTNRTLTIPSGITPGTMIQVIVFSTGTITIARGSGVNLYWLDGSGGIPANSNRVIGRGGWVTLYCLGVNDWFITGVGVT